MPVSQKVLSFDLQILQTKTVPLLPSKKPDERKLTLK